jgi:hypothetical protein
MVKKSSEGTLLIIFNMRNDNHAYNTTYKKALNFENATPCSDLGVQVSRDHCTEPAPSG